MRALTKSYDSAMETCGESGNVSHRTDGGVCEAQDSTAARDLRNRQEGEICIEHGEMTFVVNHLRIFLSRGRGWLCAIAAPSALDVSRQKI
jgi:hypothetical protein